MVPGRDIDTIATELILADLQTLEQGRAPAGQGSKIRQESRTPPGG